LNKAIFYITTNKTSTPNRITDPVLF